MKRAEVQRQETKLCALSFYLCFLTLQWHHNLIFTITDLYVFKHLICFSVKTFPHIDFQSHTFLSWFFPLIKQGWSFSSQCQAVMSVCLSMQKWRAQRIFQEWLTFTHEETTPQHQNPFQTTTKFFDDHSWCLSQTLNGNLDVHQ